MTWFIKICRISRNIWVHTDRHTDIIRNVSFYNIEYTHSTDCPDGFVQSGDFCYQSFTENVPMADASQRCRDIGAILAEPRTAEEHTAIAEIVRANDYWLGLTTDVPKAGPWTWQSDGQTAEWFNWYPAQPDNSDGFCVYVNVGYNSTWQDLNCVKYPVPYVCQTTGK